MKRRTRFADKIFNDIKGKPVKHLGYRTPGQIDDTTHGLIICIAQFPAIREYKVDTVQGLCPNETIAITFQQNH